MVFTEKDEKIQKLERCYIKILFFVDPHYSSMNLDCRKDYFPDTMIDKTNQLLQIAVERKVDLVVCGGDFGHSKRMSIPYLNKLVAVYRSYDLNYATVIGNHDIYYTDIKTVGSAPLGTFLSSGIFKPEGPDFTMETDDCVILFMPYMVEPPVFTMPKVGNKKHVLFGHQFLPGRFKTEVFPIEMADEFDFIGLGHDHDVYEPVRIGRALIARPGALSRGTRVQSNWNRGVYVSIIDTEAGTCENVPLKVKLAEEIFSKERIVSEKRIQDAKIIDELTKSVMLGGDEDVNTILNGMAIEDKVKDRVIHWLKEYAII